MKETNGCLQWFLSLNGVASRLWRNQCLQGTWYHDNLEHDTQQEQIEIYQAKWVSDTQSQLLVDTREHQQWLGTDQIK